MHLMGRETFAVELSIIIFIAALSNKPNNSDNNKNNDINNNHDVHFLSAGQ